MHHVTGSNRNKKGSVMTANNRSVQEQQELNAQMCAKETLEYVLHEALHADPATPGEVRDFLRTAPPEIRILIKGVTAQTGSPEVLDDIGKARVDLLRAGVVGWLLRKGGHQ